MHHSIARVLERRIAGVDTERLIAFEKSEPMAIDPALAIEGSSEFAPISIGSDGIATISVNGIIAHGASAFEKSCYGGVSPSDITASVRAAYDSSAVRGIVLHIDSPGGTVAGVPEAGAEIGRMQAEGKKPIFTFVDSLLASAAYWIAAGTKGIYSTALADVGSIGVYIPWIDSTVAHELEGLKVDLIKDGKYKGAGYPGTTLAEEDRARMQEQVNQIGAAFRSHVTSYRPLVRAEAMQGQTYLGQEAEQVGLVDDVVPSIEKVKEMIVRR